MALEKEEVLVRVKVPGVAPGVALEKVEVLVKVEAPAKAGPLDKGLDCVALRGSLPRDDGLLSNSVAPCMPAGVAAAGGRCWLLVGCWLDAGGPLVATGLPLVFAGGRCDVRWWPL